MLVIQFAKPSINFIRKRPTIEKAKTLGNAFIESQFKYAPLYACLVGKHCILNLKKFVIRL